MSISFESGINVQALIISTFLSFLSVNSSIVEKFVLIWMNKQTDVEKTLIEQRNSLKNQQSSLNIVDEFAKYSKIQRRINAIDEELTKIKGSKPTNSFLMQLSFTYGVKLFFVILIILFSIYYRYTPVFYLGDKINLMPFTRLICYPNEPNYVSFYFWVLCTATMARLIKTSFS